MSRAIKKDTRNVGPHWIAGNTPLNVGSYTRIKPAIDMECTGCLLCFVYCPDGAISVVEEGKKVAVDFNLCKACGICAYECPQKAIRMVSTEK